MPLHYLLQFVLPALAQVETFVHEHAQLAVLVGLFSWLLTQEVQLSLLLVESVGSLLCGFVFYGGLRDECQFAGLGASTLFERESCAELFIGLLS